jgi:hypothetical protein
LFGPIGPQAIARLLLREADSGEGTYVRGEQAFILAELALTLDRVEWTSTLRYVDARQGRKQVRKLIAGLAQTRADFPADPSLSRYVDEAFAKVSR